MSVVSQSTTKLFSLILPDSIVWRLIFSILTISIAWKSPSNVIATEFGNSLKLSRHKGFTVEFKCRSHNSYKLRPLHLNLMSFPNHQSNCFLARVTESRNKTIEKYHILIYHNYWNSYNLLHQGISHRLGVVLGLCTLATAVLL